MMNRMKSTGKPQSITTETRVSNSQMFNNKNLMNSSVPQLNQYMSYKIRESEDKQIEFLREKNAQLHERIKRSTLTIRDLEQNNRILLDMNRKYVDVVNRYYQNEFKKNINDVNLKKSNGKRQQELNDLNDENYNRQNISSSQAHRLLEKLEKDHRNLVKHCLVMEQQIKNYSEQINHYNKMKDQLHAVNHTCVDQLIQQLHQLSEENKILKKQNNLITYQLQKSRLQCSNIKKMNGKNQMQAGNSEFQISKMKSIMNTVKQESEDKSKTYQARIYQLELKAQKLEHQLRYGQEGVIRSDEQRKSLVMKHVEHIHEYEKLSNSYIQLQDSFWKNKKGQRSFSLRNKKKGNRFDMDDSMRMSIPKIGKKKIKNGIGNNSLGYSTII